MVYKKKIFVTGGSGLLGSALIKQLIINHNEIWVLQNESEINYSNINIIRLSDIEINNTLPVFDFVFHLAAKISYDSNANKALYEANVELTQQIISKTRFTRFIHASTVSVYELTDNFINETSPISPQNNYAHSKLWAEHLVKQLPSFSILRFSSLFGVNMKQDNFIKRAICQAIETDNITIFGNGIRKQNYLNTNQSVNYLLSAANCNDNWIGLAVDNVSYSNSQIAAYIQDLTGCKITYQGIDNSYSFVYNNSVTLSKLKIQIKENNLNFYIQELLEWIKATK